MRFNFLPLSAVLTALLWFPLQAKAQSYFGNTPIGGDAFDFVADGGISGGGALSFTPNQDFSFTSITVWLTGYTGLDMYGNKNQSFYAGIYDDQANMSGQTMDQPGNLIASLAVPPPNDGSESAFTFDNTSPTTLLHANTKYWVFIYEATSGSYNYDSAPQWVQGDQPTGNATYDGSESFWDFEFSNSSATPAFSINTVPEPRSIKLLFLMFSTALGIAAFRRFYSFSSAMKVKFMLRK